MVLLLVFTSLVGFSGIKILGFLGKEEGEEEEEVKVKEKEEGVNIEVFSPFPFFPFLLGILLT